MSAATAALLKELEETRLEISKRKQADLLAEEKARAARRAVEATSRARQWAEDHEEKIVAALEALGVPVPPKEIR